MSTEFKGICSRSTMLRADELLYLTDRSHSITLKKGQHIYRQDTFDPYIYVVKSGTVKVVTSGDTSREVIKAVLFEDMVFGESAINLENRDSAAVALETGTVVLAIDINAVKKVMSENFNFCLFVMEEMRTKLAFAEKRMASLVVSDARGRIVDFIKYNASKTGTLVGLETLVKHSLTQQDIANYTGTSRQTVTSVFNELRNDNLIYFKRKSILVRDLDSLA